MDHSLTEKYCYDEFHKKYGTCFICYATHVQNNRDHYPLSLVDQDEQGISCKDVQFVTKEKNCRLFWIDHLGHYMKNKYGEGAQTSDTVMACHVWSVSEIQVKWSSWHK